VLLAFVLLSLDNSAFGQLRALSQMAQENCVSCFKAKASNVPEIPYKVVQSFFKLPPNVQLGAAAGVATNSKGHLFVFTRASEARLLEFDEKGTFVREI